MATLRMATLLVVLACAARPARADAPAEVLVWYRSAGSCPDGDSFIARLTPRVPGARLAGAGDRVDFVVTLRGDGKKSYGRLERQTQRGTVAIRELEGAECAELADAVGLSLALTVEPEPKPVEATAPQLGPAKTVGSAPAEQPAPPAARRDFRRDPGRPAKDARLRGSVAVRAQLATAIAPVALPGGALFVGLERGDRGPLPGASARVGLSVFLGPAETELGEVRYRLVTGRLEGCPLRLGGDSLSVRPCAELELGSLQVEGSGASGRSDRALWAAVGAFAGASWRATDALAFELLAGGFVPLTRYELDSGDPSNGGHRTGALGFSAGVGTSVRLP